MGGEALVVHCGETRARRSWGRIDACRSLAVGSRRAVDKPMAAAVAIAVAVGEGGSAHDSRHVGVIVEARRLVDSGAWRCGDGLEGVLLLGDLRGRFRKRSACLVVGEIWLSRIGKQRKDCGDPLGRSNLASRDH